VFILGSEENISSYVERKLETTTRIRSNMVDALTIHEALIRQWN
jgi:hypothetical protein